MGSKHLWTTIEIETLKRLKAKKGLTFGKIAKAMGMTGAMVRGKWQRLDREKVSDAAKEQLPQLLALIKNNPLSVREISTMLDRSETSVRAIVDDLQGAGYNITRGEKTIALDTKTIRNPIPPSVLHEGPVNQIRFAVLSDPHGGSKHQQITSTRAFVRMARKAGCKHIFVPGDLTAGRKVYTGQEYELFTASVWGQLVAANWGLPALEGLEYFIIGGNHDYRHIKNGDPNPVSLFADQRPDAHYLGYSKQMLPLTDTIAVELYHPRGGTPYSDSYRVQKGGERMVFEQLYQSQRERQVAPWMVLLTGHLHSTSLVMRKPGWVGVQCGCFEGTTSLLKELHLTPMIGGYLVTLDIDAGSGMVIGDDFKWKSFPEIHNDYLNYPEMLQELRKGEREAPVEEVETLFTFEEKEEDETATD